MRIQMLLLLLWVGCERDVDEGPQQPLAEPLTIAVLEGPTIPNHRQLAPEVDGATTSWAACTRTDDPEDVLLAEVTEATDAPVLDLFGLAAGFTYDCEVHAPELGRVGTVAVEIPAFPAAWPTFAVERDEDLESWGAWTVANSISGCEDGAVHSHVVVVDPDGLVRWGWDAGTGYVADLDVTWVPESRRLHVGGGWGYFDEGQANRGFTTQVDLAGAESDRREAPAFGIGFNHHSQPLPSGEILNLTASYETGAAGVWWYGVGVELWDPVAGAPSWTWSSQALADAGLEGPFSLGESPYHANSVSFVDDPLGPAMYVSLYLGREIWRVDRETGERTHTIGPFGEMTLQDLDGAPLADDQWFWGQHDPQYTVVGDKVRALLHDNGADRPDLSLYSRVAEVELDLSANTVTLLWDWTEPGWFNPIVGDGDRLPNGNVLITKGFMQCWTPWSPDASQLVELEPDSGGVAWRLTWEDPGRITFRGERLDGCDLFSSAQHCPAVAARLSELRSGG